MKVRRHISIVSYISFLLLIISFSCFPKIESYENKIPRIIVYEYYYYRIQGVGAIDPRFMTDDELGFFKHLDGYYFEYIGKIEMEHTKVFVLYSLGDQITVFSIHEFPSNVNITAEDISLDLYERGKTTRDKVYNDFKEIITRKLTQYHSIDDQVPLVYVMIKDCLSPAPLIVDSLDKEIVEVHDEKGQVLLWKEPLSGDDVLYIINAYPPNEERVGGFEPDNTFLRNYVYDIVRAWSNHVSTVYEGFTEIISNNLYAIDQDPIAMWSFLPYIAARYSNYEMMSNLDRQIYHEMIFLSDIDENTKREIKIEVTKKNFDDDEEFQEMLLDYIDYIYEKIENSNNLLKEKRNLYQNEIERFDMLYICLFAVLGIIYGFYKILRSLFNSNRILHDINFLSRARLLIPHFKTSVLILMISVFCYDIYVIHNLLSQNPYETRVGVPEVPYNTNMFFVMFFLVVAVFLLLNYGNKIVTILKKHVKIQKKF